MLGLRPSEEKVGDALECILGFCSWTGVITLKGILNAKKRNALWINQQQ